MEVTPESDGSRNPVVLLGILAGFLPKPEICRNTLIDGNDPPRRFGLAVSHIAQEDRSLNIDTWIQEIDVTPLQGEQLANRFRRIIDHGSSISPI